MPFSFVSPVLAKLRNLHVLVAGKSTVWYYNTGFHGVLKHHGESTALFLPRHDDLPLLSLSFEEILSL